jgi:hypothetical protein
MGKFSLPKSVKRSVVPSHPFILKIAISANMITIKSKENFYKKELKK